MKQDYLNQKSMGRPLHQRRSADPNWPHGTGNNDCDTNNGENRTNVKTCNLHVFTVALLLFFALFTLAPQQAQAADVNPGNVFGSYTSTNVRYDAGGYYFMIEIYGLGNGGSGEDGDYTEQGELYVGGELAFRFNDRQNGDDEANDFWWKITAHNGYALHASHGASSGSGGGYVTTGNTVNGITNVLGSGNAWIRVKVYLSQSVITSSTTKTLAFKLWDQDNNENGSNCSFPTGSTVTMPTLPSISNTTPVFENGSYYAFDYSINNNVSQPVTVTAWSPTVGCAQSWSHAANTNITKTLNYSSTSGCADDWLDSREANHTVNLKAEWTHATTGIVYTAEKTGIEIKHIRYPSSIEVINNNDGTLNIKWATDALSSSKSDDGWRLQYLIGENSDSGTWKDMPSGTTVPAVDNSKTQYGTLFTIPEAERKQGEQNYYFRVSRKCVGNSTAYKETSLPINTNYKQLTNYAMDEGKDNYSRLTWELTSSGIYCPDDISLKLRIGTTETDITDSLEHGAFQTSINEGVVDCSPQRYQLILKNGNDAAITYTVNDKYVYMSAGKREYENMTVSKGYHPDKINIKWALRNGYDEFTRFRIMRKQLEEAEDAWVMVGSDISHTRNTLTYNYDDTNINAGIYYQYRIEGFYQCADSIGNKPSPEFVGFSQPFGSVSGRITYAGSSAVAGVSVNLATNDALRSNRELSFLGTANSFINVPAKEKLLNPGGFSFQVWLNKSGSGAQMLVNNGSVVIKLDASNHPVVTLGNKTLTADTAIIRAGEYNHLTVTASKSGSSYNVQIYVNGKLKKGGVLAPSSALTNSSLIKVGNAYKGFMDDIRFWNKALSAEEILLNYDRILSGKESGLVAYYKCDETDKINSDLFDCSAEGTQFNGNHALKGIDATRRDVSIEAGHISLKGVTDANGIYTITNSVPFTSEGTTYTIAPSLGIHKFDPTKRPLFFSPDSKVSNNVDFTDVSSFPVSGVVYYANSEYPVDSVIIYVDGTPASKDGELIMTNSNGEFTIDVPIGDHFIEVKKDGHVFADNGRFPKDPNKTGTKHNFQEKMTGFLFTDQTTVRLMGRVAGGDPQTGLPLGFGLSNANIGKATIQLQAVNTVNKLTIAAQDSTFATTIGNKESKVTFKPFSADVRNIIEIETNPETGEFLAILPPVTYNVVGVKTKEFEDGAGDQSLDFTYSKMVFDMRPGTKQTAEYTDTLKVKHTYEYHDSLKVTRYNDPVIDVADLNAAQGAFGDSVYIYRNTILDTTNAIQLYNVLPNGSIDYVFGYPVFTEENTVYNWEISTYEEYVNNDDSANPVTDKVKLSGQVIDIQNGLSSGFEESGFEYGKDDNPMIAAEGQIKMNEEGKFRFSFRVGYPNLGGNHLLATKISLDKNGKTFTWNNHQPEGTDFMSYLLGLVPSDASNFVTQGPDKIDFVLSDPPGSYSFATIEKGSTITKSHQYTDNYETSEEAEVVAHLGLGLRILAGGPGLMTESKHEVIADLTGTIGGTQSWVRGKRTETTLTFNESVSTSGDVAFVGTDADIYIGQSNNRVFGMQRSLSFYPKAEDNTGSSIVTSDQQYALFPKEVLTTGDEFSTIFTFTQGYIINTQIPNTKALRNALIRHWDGDYPADGSSLTFKNSKGKNIPAIYLSNLDVLDPEFGTAGTYRTYYSPTAKKQEKVDEVSAYNAWIASWERAISNNERDKVALFDNRSSLESKQLMHNRSFNAGANVSESMTAAYDSVIIENDAHSVYGSFSENGGYVWNDQLGVEETFTVGRNNSFEDENETSNASEVTFSFELSEDGGDYLRGTNDALTVDIYLPLEAQMNAILANGTQNRPASTLRGYTFNTRAGQTSCPYEPGDSTLYYKKGGKKQLLNYATFVIEKPELYINSTKIATAENIPAGREATFSVQMQNMSETKNEVTYQLSISDYSNLNGLILSIDGTPLTEPREYVIAYGEELIKTLKVRQSSLDILNYEDIELQLSSSCDNSDYTSSSATLSVTYAPSSSPVALAANSQLVNRFLMDTKGGKVTFTISDYDRSFKNFTAIRLQMKREGEDWPITSIAEFANDGTLPASVTYDYTFKENVPADDRYVFRALTVSIDGVNEITTSSEEITIVKDVRNPELLGNASPVTGILNAGGEISITFNEDIQTGLVTTNNFSVTGVLNASIRMEPVVGLSFDGTGRAYTELPIYTNGSFSIETWMKWPAATAGTLFAYGEGNQYISLGFDAAGHAIVTIGNETKISAGTITASEAWKYIGLSYNRSDKTVSVYIFEGDNNLSMFNSASFTTSPATEGKLFVGNNAAQNGFHGAIGLLHFYSEARSMSEMNESKYTVKSGNEPNLIGLWELEEGKGTVAIDKARSRHLALNTSWYIYPAGKSLAFNGTNDYAAIPSATFPFTTYDNFTWEFWFKAPAQNEATLLSIGSMATIGFNAEHKLVLTVGGNSQVLATQNLLDNQWHHFALSVKRTGKTNVIIDGNTTASFTSNGIFTGSVGGGYYYLGAKYTQPNTYSQYFTGNIDELRVWGSALTTDAVVLNHNRKLRGDEAGLLAYYPFESYQKLDQVYSVYESLNDAVAGSTSAVGNMAAVSNVAVPMIDCRPVTAVSFNVVASDRKIVLNLLEDDYKLEGVTLTFSAKEIYDMHNNSSNVITWTAYVNRNALNWQTDVIDLKIAQGEGQTFKAVIANSGGTAADYYISNLPSWLSVNASSGNLQPLASKELTFTIPQSINIGSYEASITLTGSNNVQKILPVRLKVTGKRPDWAVNPNDFEHSMTVTGQVLIESLPQEDTNDLLAAFIDGQCVGLTSPQYEPAYQAYFVFMTIWGDSDETNKSISFKLWDAGTGRIYPVIEQRMNNQTISVQFNADDYIGTPDEPVLFNALNMIEQSITLNKGWNWISFNVENEDPELINQFKTNSLSFANQLKANNGQFINNSGASWGGLLDTLTNTNAYLARATKPATLKVMGKAVNPLDVPISLSPLKWTWIGYTPQFSLSVSEALAGIANPQVGDQIKGQKGYQIRSSNGWVGSLGAMEPGLGYMYKSGNSNTVSFNYPNVAPTNKSVSAPNIDAQFEEPYWATDSYRYGNTMTVTASIFIDNEEILGGPIEIAAFSGDECRGSAVMQYIAGFEHPYMGFLMIYGENNDPLHFRVYDHFSNTEYQASEEMPFRTDSIFGSPDNLYTLNLQTGASQIKNGSIQIYPNPVETTLFLSHSWELLEQVQIMDISGRVLLTKNGYEPKSIDVTWMKPGSYFLRLTTEGQTNVYKFIKKLQ